MLTKTLFYNNISTLCKVTLVLNIHDKSFVKLVGEFNQMNVKYNKFMNHNNTRITMTSRINFKIISLLPQIMWLHVEFHLLSSICALGFYSYSSLGKTRD